MLKLLLVSALCAFVAASPAERQKRQANNCDIWSVANPCIDNPTKSVYFPHPSDNTKFIQCDRFGRMYIIQCPQNHVFVPSTSSCRSILVGTTAVPTAVVHGNYNPCTRQALAAGKIYFAVPGDKHSFIECDLLGHANVLQCPSNLDWSESQLSCVYDFTTIGRPITDHTQSTDLKADCSAANIQANHLYFSHPDPTKFIQCDPWGDKFVMNCPAGLVWAQYLETCTYAFLQVSGVGK